MNSADNHGGKRPGAGRPKGSGKYNEPTVAIRVPQSSVSSIHKYLETYRLGDSLSMPEHIHSGQQGNQKLAIPLYSSKVAAGFPSPAEDHIDDTLDLNEYLVARPDSTFMLKVEGESMRDIGIMPSDILIVDRAVKAHHGKIVIAAVDGELTVKRLFHRGELIKLLPENPNYPEIEIEHESQLHIWGVVVGSFRRFNPL